MTAALVTGAAGFIGRQVVAALVARGVTVHGLMRRDPGPDLPPGLARWSAAGLTDPDLGRMLDGVDRIFHCAGSGSVARSLTDPEGDFTDNVAATARLLGAARAGGQRVVLLSSAGVYGRAPAQPIRAEAPLAPISPYGLHKQMAEMLAHQAATRFGQPVITVRLFSVYGAGLRKQLLWDACRRLSGGATGFAGTGAETRDFIHVADAADLLIAAADRAAADGPVINGGTGVARRVDGVLGGLARRLGVTAPLRFDGQTRPGDPQHYQADIAPALALGWQPACDFEAGLDAYVTWFRGLPPAVRA